MIKFTVYGEPVAQGRPRASIVNGYVQMYDPKKSRDYKQYIRLVASEHKPDKLFGGPLSMKVAIYKPTLKSFSKKKRESAEKGEIRPITKPDVDNYIKSVFDGLNQVIWKDDSQVVDLHVSKFYSENPRIEVEIRELEG